MKAALLLLAAAVVGAAGCTNNDISLSIIQMQARRLATFLRGEGAYKAFSFKW